MKMLKALFVAATVAGLFACTDTQQSDKKSKATTKVGYLKENISQAELNNPKEYKRYSYTCRNFETGGTSYLTGYFPLSLESRRQENFGFYFQLNGGKVQPFDHLENKSLNTRGTRFEVSYRSYYPIEGSYVDLTARELSSIYRKNGQTWLECRES